MRKKREEAGQRVYRALRTTERAGERAIVDTSRFMATMLAARNQAGLSAVLGQEALGYVAAANTKFVEGMQMLVQAHTALKDVKSLAGLGPVQIGDVDDCPKLPSGIRSLEAVA